MSMRRSLLAATAASVAVLCGGAMAETYFHRAPVTGMSSPNALQTDGGAATPTPPPAPAPDTTPDAFAIASLTAQAPGSIVTSAPVTISGITESVPISVSGGGSVSVAGGAYATSGSIANGQSFTVRVTTPAGTTSAQTQSVTVTVGGVQSVWSVGTRAFSTTPDAFAIASLTEQAPGSIVTSAPVTISGITESVPISVSGGGSVSVAGGAYATSGSIANGQSFTVRVTTPAGTTSTQTQSVTVTVGGVQSVWSVGTRALDTTPDAFALQAQSGVAVGSTPVSNEVTISGIEAPVPFTVTSAAGAYGIYVNGSRNYASSGTVSNGDKVKAIVSASTEPSTASTATVTIGGVSSVFSVTTEPPDSTPDPFTIAAASGVAGNTTWTSPSFTPAGVNTSMTASVTGQGSPKLLLNNGQVASGTLSRNTSTYLLLSLGAEDGTNYAGTVTIGGVSAPYSVTVKDKVPNAYAIPALTGQTTGTMATSASVTPSGFTDATSITVSGDGNPGIDVAGDGNFQSSRTIAPGQSFRVRLTNSASGGVTSNAVVSIGGVNATFSATTVTAAPAASCPGQAEFYGYGHFCQEIPAGCNSGITYTIGSGGQMGGGGAGGQTVCVDVTPNGSGACYAVGFTWCTGNTNIYLRMNWN